MKKIYEWSMIIFAVLAVSTIWHQTPYNPYIIWTVWGIFFIDFLFRILNSDKKIAFLKKNPFLILAIIPVDAVFQFARFARVIHLFRLKTITKYFAKPFIKKLQKKSIMGFVIPVALTLISSFSLYVFEPTVTSLYDAFLYGFLAIIMFGHADITAVSMIGQAIIISITLIGVMLHGIVLGIIFEILEKKKISFPFGFTK
ncbi:hypothetical protein [Texcoconibacillus texcoconensis]|uniref:Voltage-gated potassium channel n=1 Tax=Texcoconibacillus texcoconensis TaxID=1095777 RepID=A0A840QS17_9BACI|nr:hypothetical protein [Texcoconibacillus texcoconensis]MBB5174155.1 voltage-gated potassium channel [Texcoconibacillus texcoconensis]